MLIVVATRSVRLHFFDLQFPTTDRRSWISDLLFPSSCIIDMHFPTTDRRSPISDLCFPTRYISYLQLLRYDGSSRYKTWITSQRISFACAGSFTCGRWLSWSILTLKLVDRSGSDES